MGNTDHRIVTNLIQNAGTGQRLVALSFCNKVTQIQRIALRPVEVGNHILSRCSGCALIAQLPRKDVRARTAY